MVKGLKFWIQKVSRDCTCTFYVAKTKTLFWAFVFIYAKHRFSQEAVHIRSTCQKNKEPNCTWKVPMRSTEKLQCRALKVGLFPQFSMLASFNLVGVGW